MTTGSMKCPHCLIAFHVSGRHIRNLGSNDIRLVNIGQDLDAHWWLEQTTCPSCGRFILKLVSSYDMGRTNPNHPSYNMWPEGAEQAILIRPKHTGRSPIPSEVPPEFTGDYKEACLVLADSPKSSAALSRRCLQHILREKARGIQHPNDLAKAIGEAVDDPGMPPDIARSLDAVRNIGNFAAHPNKSTATGEIVEVEPGEAEWCLEVIEMLFDFYFVRPADIRRREDDLDSKLREMGKPGLRRVGQDL